MNKRRLALVLVVVSMTCLRTLKHGMAFILILSSCDTEVRKTFVFSIYLSTAE